LIGIKIVLAVTGLTFCVVLTNRTVRVANLASCRAQGCFLIKSRRATYYALAIESHKSSLTHLASCHVVTAFAVLGAS